MTSPAHPRARRRLWPLAVPAVLYVLAPLLANRIEPRIAGVPFLVAYVLAVTIVSPVLIWLVARGDPLYRAGAPEPVPADDPGPRPSGHAGDGTTEAARHRAPGTDDAAPPPDDGPTARPDGTAPGADR